MILLLLAGMVGFGVLIYLARDAAALTLPEGLRLDMAHGLRNTMLPSWEDTLIFTIAEAKGVDARLLAAIRKAEMGGAGREFGVLSTPAPNYHDQASIAANTIRNNTQRYEDETNRAARVNSRYTEDFIRYLGSKYAPVGVENDPSGLNANWVGNVINWYRSIDYV